MNEDSNDQIQEEALLNEQKQYAETINSQQQMLLQEQLKIAPKEFTHIKLPISIQHDISISYLEEEKVMEIFNTNLDSKEDNELLDIKKEELFEENKRFNYYELEPSSSKSIKEEKVSVEEDNEISLPLEESQEENVFLNTNKANTKDKNADTRAVIELLDNMLVHDNENNEQVEDLILEINKLVSQSNGTVFLSPNPRFH